ncbi:MAG: transcription antitermination factor NusB [Chloroflexi bacterium]|nr:transcription antitermination factor NusB [Chloroflexota bacterium]
MAAGQRRRARIAALQALYEADTSAHLPQESLLRILAEEQIAQAPADFARELIEGVLAKRDEIDRTIADAAPAWPVDQLAAIDRNILRLAIREMLGDNGTPVSVVINEAVELAKSFGSEKSASFVNGVLGTIARQQNGSQSNQPTKGRG